MTPTEQKLLGPVIKAVIGGCPDSWNRLKYEIFDFGYQLIYPAQSDFYPQVDRLMARLDEATRVALIEAWLAARPSRKNLPDAKILLTYRGIIIETIVQRAKVAAYRSNQLEG